MSFATNGASTDFKGFLGWTENTASMREEKEEFLEDEIPRPLGGQQTAEGSSQHEAGLCC